MEITNFKDLIKSKDLADISLEHFTIGGLSNNTNVISIFQSALYDTAYFTKIKFTELEARTYAFKIKPLAYDIWGNTDSFFIIMFLNNLRVAGDLTIEKLKDGIYILNNTGMSRLKSLLEFIKSQKFEKGDYVIPELEG